MNIFSSIAARIFSLLESPGGDSYLLAEARHRPRDAGPPGATRSAHVLLLDVSGSMAENDYPPSRLHGGIEACKRFIARLHKSEPEALVGVVTFSESARVACRMVCLKEGRSRLERNLDRLRPESSTVLRPGLEAARALFVEAGAPDLWRRILILTDGNTCVEGLETMANQCKREGIQLDIIGIGGSPLDVDEALLNRLASVVDGERRYWFIRSKRELVNRFETLALREVHPEPPGK
jgi:Mg-chelatase subunit ChlD